MLQCATTTESSSLPPPVTADRDVARSQGRIGVERSAAPSLIAFTAGLLAVSSNQPKALLLFIGAGTVTIGLHFVVPSRDDEETRPIMSTFLRRLPDIFTAVGCALIVLGIGLAFPHEIALVPLFLFISFAALAAVFGMILGVWTTATLYGAALVSLATFVVLTFIA
ncbi:hypothetical protein OG21DRAFT_1514243 [Imleria badia]|nr:hypothetical protein OG21DRAFT_1514243 [Imleria badia]